MKSINYLFLLFICCICFLFDTTTLAAPTDQTNKTTETINSSDILYYISDTWKSLERSMNDCQSLIDAKTQEISILYLPYKFPKPKLVADMEKNCNIVVKYLPSKITRLGEIDGSQIKPPGLLYLPSSYIVPGGMFNEMYGWDSYFIVRGLIEAQKFDVAHGMLENLFFEIDHYGGILNGNRTYYLSRTQLPFLAPSIRVVYEADIKRSHTNQKWLARAYTYAVKDYQFWTRAPHLAGNTQLSRFYDFGEGPVIEMVGSAKNYYEDIIRYFLLHPQIAQPYLYQSEETAVPEQNQRSLFNISLCEQNNCKTVKNIGLTDYFYKGDRAMRESGFDTSFRFGPFSADTVDYIPVDLNSLLYKAEKDLEWMAYKLGMHKAAHRWHRLAASRRNKINRYLWNESLGLYFDYNFQTGQQSSYPYATAFYPLWAGVATQKQAKKVVSNLKLFEKAGGIVTSLQETGVQWDYPYGWAPIQLIAIEGMEHYGFRNEANRISHKFLQMVLKNFAKEKTIREKYNVVSSSSHTDIKVGYKVNVIGFGWTNSVFLVLFNRIAKQSFTNLVHLKHNYEHAKKSFADKKPHHTKLVA